MPLTIFQRDNNGDIQHSYKAGIYSEPRDALPLPGEMSHEDFIGFYGHRFMANVTGRHLFDERSADTAQLKETLAAHLTRGGYRDFYVEEHFVHGHTDFRLTFLDARQAQRFVAGWDGLFEESPGMTSRNTEIMRLRNAMAAADRGISGLYDTLAKGFEASTAAIANKVGVRTATAQPV